MVTILNRMFVRCWGDGEAANKKDPQMWGVQCTDWVGRMYLGVKETHKSKGAVCSEKWGQVSL